MHLTGATEAPIFSLFITNRMYKQKKKFYALRKTVIWLKRKLLLILAALMIGFANGMSGRDDMVNDNQVLIEQKDKKD